MATARVALARMPPQRSKEALLTLIDAWQGLVGSDGYGVSHHGGNRRPPCVAPLLRRARGVSAPPPAARAVCGPWALKAWHRRGARATAPPTGGAWRAWSARWCPRSGRDHARQDAAGRVPRRWHRERASRWGFLCEPGVDTTHHRAERAVRCGVLWRQGAPGTARDPGNRWGERRVSLRHTCRQLGKSTCGVLVKAVTSLCGGHHPDLSWLY